MGATERCPICSVPVKAENLSRHIDDTHPRHPDAAAIRERIQAERRYAPKKRRSGGIRIRRGHIAVALVIVLLGAAAYVAAPFFDPYANFGRDSCINEEAARYHIHVTLAIRVDGSVFPIPTDAGRSSTCTKPLHTHAGEYNPTSDPARIHVESPVPRDFTLGDFFAVWGQPFTLTQVATCVSGGGRSITMQVNGVPSSAFGSLVLRDGQAIAVDCGPVY